MMDEVLNLAVAQLGPAKANLQTDAEAMSKALTKVEAEIANLTSAVASGVDVRSLVTALKAREEERDKLQKQLAHVEVAGKRAAVTPSRLREDLRARFEDWRGVLRRQPALARQVITKLIDGPIKFTGKRDSDRRGYFEFEATARIAKLLHNLNPIMVASPTGFEPVFWP